MSVVFFTDRDLGLKFPAILREAGLSVETHGDHFPPTCPDSTWLATVAAKRWVALTHDGRIRYKPNELAEVIRHRVSLLVVVGKAPYPVLGKVYRATPRELERNANAPGRVELWYPKAS